jgi:cellulose biosynthesis protein BcsQ
MTDVNSKYLIWNNKGGVGKTFLTYMLSVEYALMHPEIDVVVLDVCPQSNVSEMILGGNGRGEEQLSQFKEKNRTIAGYIKERYERSRSMKLGNEIGFFVKAHEFNKNMPENLYLLPGDVDLDICSIIINYWGLGPERDAWKKSRLLLKDLVDSFEMKEAANNRKKIFFIDCNPSFSNYTEMAILASSRVIVPCTADAASVRGIYNLFKLMYGISVEKKQKVEEDDLFLNFNRNSETHALLLPYVHLFILNRSRTNLKKAAKAFKSHVDKIHELASSVKKRHPNVFTSLKGEMVLNVKDGNTLASIINHEGQALSRLPPTTYTIYGQTTQANETQIIPLLEDLKAVIERL